MIDILKEMRSWQVPALLVFGGVVLIFLSFFKIDDISKATFIAYPNFLIAPLITGCSLLLVAAALHIIGNNNHAVPALEKSKANSAVADAVLELVPDGTALSSSYAKILRAQHSRLTGDIRRLSEKGDWSKLLEVRARIREYYEWSGQYEEGIEQGRIYVNALNAVNAPNEELCWARVKDLGWLQILAGHIEQGREQISTVLSGLTAYDTNSELARLVFYCHRYIGVSYQRQEPADLDRAAASFRDAQKAIERLPNDTRALIGRITRNLGNVALDLGLRAPIDLMKISEALSAFQESLKVFLDLRDEEHQAITRIQLGQALIATPGRLEEGQTEFLMARRLATRIGWQEGIARSTFFLGKVHEQRASYADDSVARCSELTNAKDEYEDCDRICSQIDDFLWKGRSKESLARVNSVLGEIC